MVFSELFAGQPSTHISEAVDILLASLTVCTTNTHTHTPHTHTHTHTHTTRPSLPQFPERSVAMTAIDTLTLLTEVAPQMQASLPVTPARILRSICHSLSQFMTHPELKRTAWVTKVSGCTTHQTCSTCMLYVDHTRLYTLNVCCTTEVLCTCVYGLNRYT